MTICPSHKSPAELIRVGIEPFVTEILMCEKCEKEDIERHDSILKQLEDESAQERMRFLYDGIPERFKEALLSDFPALGKIGTWIKKPKGFLMVIGPTGTGKSHLVCAMAKELRMNGFGTKIVFSSDLFRAIRKSFNRVDLREPSEAQIVEELIRVPILLCDDIGVQKQSEFVIEAWYNIIDARHRECMPTVFTSNLSIKEISEYMSDRVASRLLSGVVVSMSGKDRRMVRVS